MLSAPSNCFVSILFVLYCPAYHRHPHSFPTRRSSDLWFRAAAPHSHAVLPGSCVQSDDHSVLAAAPSAAAPSAAATSAPPQRPGERSEEHTSELQSRGHLVCRLLLEKKKKTSTNVTPR